VQNLVWFLLVDSEDSDLVLYTGTDTPLADPGIGYKTMGDAEAARKALLRETWKDWFGIEDVPGEVLEDGGSEGFWIRIECVTLPA